MNQFFRYYSGWSTISGRQSSRLANYTKKSHIIFFVMSRINKITLWPPVSAGRPYVSKLIIVTQYGQSHSSRPPGTISLPIRSTTRCGRLIGTVGYAAQTANRSVPPECTHFRIERSGSKVVDPVRSVTRSDRPTGTIGQSIQKMPI